MADLPLTDIDNTGYWAGEPYSSVLEQLKKALTSKESLITLTGPSRVGKTALCIELIHTLRANQHQVMFLPTAPKSSAELHQALQQQQPGLSEFSFIASFEKKLLDNLQNGQSNVLIIDDAHHLNNEIITSLRVLHNLQTPSQRLLQIVLCGQPHLRQVLGHHQINGFAQRITDSLHLQNMTTTQLGDLLDGTQSTQLLKPKALTFLHQLTKGNPAICLPVIEQLAFNKAQRPLGFSQLKQVIKQQPDGHKMLWQHRLTRPQWPLAGIVLSALLAWHFFSDKQLNEQAITTETITETITEIAATIKTPVEIATLPAVAVVTDESVKDPINASEQAAVPNKVQTPIPSTTALTTPLTTPLTTQAPEQAVTTASTQVQLAVVETSSLNEQITGAVSYWMNAWQQQEYTPYFSSYIPGFIPNNNTSHRQWKRLRTIRLINPQWIKLELGPLAFIEPLSEQNAEITSNQVTIQFWLAYRSPNYQDETLKQLTLVKNQNRWLISAEESLQQRQPQSAHE